MISKSQLQVAWLVGGLGLSCCQAAYPQDLGCRDVEWAQAQISERDIAKYMKAKFEITHQEIEIGQPCRSGDTVLVSIYGRGQTVPRHQVWLAISKHGKIEIAPSE